MDGQRQVSFDAVFATNYALVVRYAERRLPSSSLAEDVAADTFTAAWTRWSTGESVELPWLYRVASNKVADHYRSTTRLKALEDALGRVVEEANDGRDWLDSLELQRALLRLPARDREVVMLTYWEGLSAADVALVTDSSVAAVWATLSRARKKLRLSLEDPTPASMSGEGGAS